MKKISGSLLPLISIFILLLLSSHSAVGSIYRPSSADAPTNGTFTKSNFDALRNLAEQHGSVRVIIELDMSYVPEGRLSKQATVQQRNTIARAQQRVTSTLNDKNFSLNRTFDLSPMMAATLKPEAITALRYSDAVKRIHLDTLRKPTLNNSVPHIQANKLHELGYSGKDLMVGVLDTGIDTSHPAFGGRVIEQACFSSGSDTTTNDGDCPNGQATQIGSPAGEPIVVDGDSSTHGTLVAGVAAGEHSNSPTVENGVGTGANIASVMVFHEDTSVSPPEALAWTSDIIAGLEYLADTVAEDHNLVAVNISLGGGRYTNTCELDPTDSVISTLRSKGIAPIVATGNDHYTQAISSPACVPDAIPVGATNISSNESIASFSNQDTDQVDLVAPGDNITGPSINNTTQTLDGTSFAAPHVAGAFLQLHQATGKTVTAIERALTITGDTIPDDRGSAPSDAKYKSVRLLDALQKLRLKSKFRVAGDTPTTEQQTSFVDESVDFGATTPIQAWYWTFGDGNDTTVQSPSHVYQNEGNYTVSLEVTSHDGDTDLSQKTIFVNDLPNVSFTISPQSPDIGEEIVFDSTVTDTGGPIKSYLWDFGDGDTSTMADTTHVFTDTGPVTVTLTVEDDSGEKATASQSFTVGEPYPRLSQAFVASDTRLSDTTAFIDVKSSTSARFKQIIVEDQVASNTTTGNLKSKTNSSCNNSDYRLGFPLLKNNHDTVTLCIWTNQSRFSLLYNIRSDTRSLNVNGLPTGISPGLNGFETLSRTIFSLEFVDSTTTLLGDTVSTTNIGDSFAYNLIYTLSKSTVDQYEESGFNISSGSDDFGFFFADVYSGNWKPDTSVSVSVKERMGDSGLKVVVTGLTRDLPGGLGGSVSTSGNVEVTSSGGSGKCLIESLGMSEEFNMRLRKFRDTLLSTSPGRWLTTVYYQFSQHND